MKKLITLIGILLIGVSCSDIYAPKESKYQITQGGHESRVVGGLPSSKLRTMKSNTLSFIARFDESARYDLGNNNQLDINKLMGFSDCNSLHHENSIRFGWRYSIDKDNIEIFAYAYSSGVMKFNYMGDVALNENVHYQIQILDDVFSLQLNHGDGLAIERTASCNNGLYYMLFPYFGGDELAPHDVSIFIEELVH
ncbi:MAG: hypothetical protein ACJAS3_001548 [Roseivirga sp.]|jgi:hypothetical protein